jgi:glycerol-3-phosphate acyltransferase PlsY
VFTALLIAGVVGYLFGALPFGYLMARSFGVDIFAHGSGNPGATNVKRILGEKFGRRGRRAGNAVFVLDAGKGAAATGWPFLVDRLLAPLTAEGIWRLHLGEHVVLFTSDHLLPMALTGLVAALVGHSFSCFTRFRGGKGVATGAGGFAVLMPLVTLLGLVVWLVTFVTTRYVSLASILAAAALPLGAWMQGEARPVLVLAALVAVFVAWRHRSNIARLLAGTEHRFARRTEPASAGSRVSPSESDTP